MDELINVPEDDTAYLVPFETANLFVDAGPAGVDVVLRVSGNVPYSNIAVSLDPVVYIIRPDFWLILVNGQKVDEVGSPTESPYEVELRNPPLGHLGIVVAGADGIKQLDWPSSE